MHVQPQKYGVIRVREIAIVGSVIKINIYSNEPRVAVYCGVIEVL